MGIGDLVSVAERYGIEVRNNGGSHHVFSARGIAESLCVPAHRPIKPVYVKNLVSVIDAIRKNTP